MNTKKRQRGLQLETLEHRWMRATFAVTNLADGPVAAADDLPGSLRQAVFDANRSPGADSIEFSTPGGVITLNSGAIEIRDAVTVNGPGQYALIIDAEQSSHIFTIDDGDPLVSNPVTLRGMTLTGGLSSEDGGAITSFEPLTISESSLTRNSAVGRFRDGGAIFAARALTIEDSLIAFNLAGEQGGGIYSRDLNLIRSVVTSNSAADAGGGIYALGSTNVVITDSSITQNIAGGGANSAGGGGVALVDIQQTTIQGSQISFNETTGDDAWGGGLFSNTTAELTGSTISGNVTRGERSRGGGMFVGNAVTVTDGAVAENTTYGKDSDGGGLAVGLTDSFGNAELSRVAVTSNTTHGDGAPGGGVSAGRNVTIMDSVVLGNRTHGISAVGGAIASGSGIVEVSGSNIRDNATTHTLAAGGAIATDTGDVSISASTLSDNRTNGSFGHGGAIVSREGGVTVTNSTLSGNRTLANESAGGAIHARTGVTLSGSTLEGNRTSGHYSRGGALHTAGDLVMNNSTISGNSTYGRGADGGGAFAVDAFVENSTISGNITSNIASDGGGLFVSGTGYLTNSTVSGNTSIQADTYGGGVMAALGSLFLSYSTIVDNSADVGGGIFVYENVDLTGSIVANNTAPNASPDLHIGGSIAAQFTLIGDKSGTLLQEAPVGSPDSSGNLIGNSASTGVIDSGLAALADNGGQTHTHALLAHSPAIDAAGDPGANPLEFDQRGAPFARNVDGDGDGVARMDMGAVEQQTPCVLAGDLDCSGQVGASDLDLVLSNWGVDATISGVPVGWVHDLPDGVIGAAELDRVLVNWGNTTSAIRVETYVSMDLIAREDESDEALNRPFSFATYSSQSTGKGA